MRSTRLPDKAALDEDTIEARLLQHEHNGEFNLGPYVGHKLGEFGSGTRGAG